MKLDQFTYLYPENPRLLHIDSELFKRINDDPNWIAERKYNESRLMLHAWEGCRFEFWNRHNEKFNYIPSADLQVALEKLPLKGYCIFDGGLRHNKTIGVKNQVIIYDMYAWNSQLLLDTPFKLRRSMNEDLFMIDDYPISLPPQFANVDFKSVFECVIKEPEIEGLVLKNLNGKIAPGRKARLDSKWMYKLRQPSGRYKF